MSKELSHQSESMRTQQVCTSVIQNTIYESLF